MEQAERTVRRALTYIISIDIQKEVSYEKQTIAMAGDLRFDGCFVGRERIRLNARLIRNPYAEGNARLTRKQPKESTHKRTRIGSLFCMLQRHCRMQTPFCGDYRQTWQSKPFKSTVRKEPPQKSQGEAALGARASGFTKRRGWHIIGERRGAEVKLKKEDKIKGNNRNCRSK